MGKHPTDRSQRMLSDERHTQGHYNGKKKFRTAEEVRKDEESWNELQTYLGKRSPIVDVTDVDSPPI